jgi:predicted RNase H-like nuclease (RuvC/YqgF family)
MDDIDEEVTNEKIQQLESALREAKKALDKESSRRINLDRENRELKAFVAMHCANNSSNAMSRVYADPMLGYEMSFFREKYLSTLAAADLAPGASPVGTISGLETEIANLKREMEKVGTKNVQKLLAHKDAEIAKLKKSLGDAKLREEALEKSKEEISAKLFMLQLQGE